MSKHIRALFRFLSAKTDEPQVQVPPAPQEASVQYSPDELRGRLAECSVARLDQLVRGSHTGAAWAAVAHLGVLERRGSTEAADLLLRLVDEQACKDRETVIIKDLNLHQVMVYQLCMAQSAHLRERGKSLLLELSPSRFHSFLFYLQHNPDFFCRPAGD